MPYSPAQRRALFAIEGGSFHPGPGEPFAGVSKRKVAKMLKEGTRPGPTGGDAAKEMVKRQKAH